MERRKRILGNVLRHRLKRERYALLDRLVRVWRLGAGETYNRKQMESRVQKETEVPAVSGVGGQCGW